MGAMPKKVVLPIAGLDDPEPCCPSILSAPLDESAAADLARGFAALSDPARLRLFSLIAAQPGGEVCACALVEPLGRAQPTVSHHLKVLYEAGLVGRERRRHWIWYWVIRDRLEPLTGTVAPAVQAAVRSGTYTRSGTG